MEQHKPDPTVPEPAEGIRQQSVPQKAGVLTVVDQTFPCGADAEAFEAGAIETLSESETKTSVPPPLASNLGPVTSLTPVLISAADTKVWGASPEKYWENLAQYCRDVRSGKIGTEEVVETTAEFKSLLACGTAGCLAFGGNDRFVVQEQIPDGSDLWFIGDIHGDMLAFRALTDYATKMSKQYHCTPLFFFLGDLFDDGDLAHGVLVEFFRLMITFPKQVAFVVGNHDVGLAYDQQSRQFRSSVVPSDFADWLNRESTASEWRELALAAIDFFRVAPCAVLLPDGTLVSHGGIPLTDHHDTIQKVEDLNEEACLEDFIWTRAHETARRKIPNRSSRGCSFGFQDFDAFCDLTKRFLNPPVRRLIRGHDHVPERWQLPPKYVRHPLLTINAMSWKQRDAFGPFERKPVIARWVPNQLPEVHQIEIPSEIIRELYGTLAVD